MRNLIANKQVLSEKQVKQIACSIIQGIYVLHREQIIHRDVSMDNILIDHFDGDNVIVVLNDFDLIRFDDEAYKTYAGKKGFMAPEISTNHYSTNVDI
jgi:serine/threonine protein kinase